MTRKGLFILFIITFSVVQTACSGGRSNIFDCPVRMVTPEKECTLRGEEVVFEGVPVMDVASVCVVDSFLVARVYAGNSGNMLHVFNLKRGRYIGDFLTEGRGPNELLRPTCMTAYKDSKGVKNVYLFDLQLFESFRFDLLKSIDVGKAELVKLGSMPGHTLYAYPYRDTLSLAKYIMPDRISSALIGRSGSKVKEIPIYPDVDAFMTLSNLSSADVFFPDSDLIAIAMCSLPQVNFLNVVSGDRYTVAVDKKYRRWEKTITESSGGMFYYASVCASDTHLFALYYGVTNRDWMKGEYSSHLHVFDKYGNFLWNISLSEQLKTIAYDSEMNCIYGIDEEDRIYRYDLSDVI